MSKVTTEPQVRSKWQHRLPSEKVTKIMIDLLEKGG